MTIQEVKNKIESNTGLVGAYITSSIDITKGDYTRLNLEYMVNLNPEDSTVHSFLAHGISGDYSMDKNYDYTIDMLKGQDMEWDSKDYLDSLVGSTITTWDLLLVGDNNPEMCYSKVWQDVNGTIIPKAWLLTRSGTDITHTETTFDQFPADEF
ncbi:MAG: hypothetical protein GY787_16795 [Alteromonadales bacterium]|nr:hypothetical protein [Alteromonadales bacterium]